MSDGLNEHRTLGDRIAALLVDLSSVDRSRRLDAVAELCKESELEADAISALVRALELNARDGVFVYRVAVAINKLHPDAVAALPSLIRLLTTRTTFRFHNWWTSERGLAGAIGTLPAMFEGGRSADGLVCSVAAFAISKLGPAAADAVPALVRSLKHKDDWVRSNAAFALGKIGAAASPAVAALALTLRDKVNGVACDAATALGALGTVASDAILPLFRRCLQDDDNGFRYCLECYEALLNMGSLLVPVLVTALADRNAAARILAADLLANDESRVMPANMLQTLVGALEDDAQPVRYHAATALGRIERHAAKEVIPALLRHASALETNEAVRYRAIDALATMGTYEPAAVAALTQAFGEAADFHLRRHIVLVLSTLGTAAEAAVPTLVSALSDEHYFVRREAAAALCTIPISAQVCESALLERVKVDNYWSVRFIATLTLAKIGRRSYEIVPALIDGLTEPMDDARYFAAAALGCLGEAAHAAVPALLRALDDSSQCVSAAAQKVLCTIGQAAVPDLLEAVCSGNPTVRACSVRVLGAMYTPADNVLPYLIHALDDENESVRAAAVVAISTFGEKAAAAVPQLIALLNADTAKVRQRAAFALERIGRSASRALPALVLAMRDEDHDVRSCAGYAVSVIMPHVSPSALDSEDEKIVGWFDRLDIAKVLMDMQVFWCIGKLEFDSLMECGNALGLKKQSLRLRELKQQGRLADLPVGESHLRNVIEEMGTLFNQVPFAPDAWTGDEKIPDLQLPRMHGERLESRWSARGRRAWLYLDRYLTIRGVLPKMLVSESQTMSESSR